MRDQGRALSAAVVAEIDRLRREARMSHEELARRTGVHRTSIGLILSGKRGVTVEVAAALCLGLDTQLSAVTKRAEDVTGACGPSRW